jgi:hypothetical protein
VICNLKTIGSAPKCRLCVNTLLHFQAFPVGVERGLAVCVAQPHIVSEALPSETPNGLKHQIYSVQIILNWGGVLGGLCWSLFCVPGGQSMGQARTHGRSTAGDWGSSSSATYFNNRLTLAPEANPVVHASTPNTLHTLLPYSRSLIEYHYWYVYCGMEPLLLVVVVMPSGRLTVGQKRLPKPFLHDSSAACRRSYVRCIE